MQKAILVKKKYDFSVTPEKKSIWVLDGDKQIV